MEEKFPIAWAEEPARRWDYQGLRLVSQQVSASVATGENLNSVADFYPLIANEAVDVVSLSQLQSGLTCCRQVASLAYAHGPKVSMMNCQANFMAHVAAALPHHSMMEVVDPGREHCLKVDSHIEDGYIVLGDTPGFGIEIDKAKLGGLKAHPPTGKGRFPFPRRQGAGLYLVPPVPGEVPWRSGP
jgi:L-alanine-DL-glutamate epimerase-like enolase superfamily enzyme